jgi:hypothetical protein
VSREGTALTPTWARVIRDAIRAELDRLHFGLPARVVSVDELVAKQVVNVQPTLREVYLDANDEETSPEPPVIQRVPVAFPAGAGWAITFPLAVGDLVYLSFAERALDRWKVAEPGARVDPVLARRSDLSDAVAIAGIRPTIAPLGSIDATNLRIGRQDRSAEIELTPEGVVTIKAATVHLAGPAGAGVARVGDSVEITDPTFLAWVQSVAAVAGPGPSGSPIPFTGQIAGVVTSASAKVKAE